MGAKRWSPGLVLPLAVLVVAAVAVAVLLSQPGSEPGPPLALPAVSALPASASSHVVVVVMENKEYGDVIGNRAMPYVNALARRAGLATRLYAIRHPSLPNYLALTGGSTFGIDSDCSDCHVRARNLVDQLVAAHRSWRAYMEGLPHPCFRGAYAGAYAKKHDPFMYYDDVARDPARCHSIVPFTRLALDLRRDRLPAFAWISPNLCDDTHDCPAASGDRFLAHLVPALVHELGPHGLLVLTWDEGTSDQGCCGVAQGGRIATLLVGPDVRRGAREGRPTSQYGILRTVESTLGLPPLRGAARSSSARLEGLLVRTPARPGARG